MFNPLRLFGRKEHIDDTAAAFIEGRATERELAELQERAAHEPGVMQDLESVRATVSLLRSVEPARAPRSFALSEAPVMVRQTSKPRLAMAPAVFAIAAAAVVGLLAAGNLANVVHQDDRNADSSRTSNLQEAQYSQESATILTGEASIEGPAGAAGTNAEESAFGALEATSVASSDAADAARTLSGEPPTLAGETGLPGVPGPTNNEKDLLPDDGSGTEAASSTEITATGLVPVPADVTATTAEGSVILDGADADAGLTEQLRTTEDTDLPAPAPQPTTTASGQLPLGFASGGAGAEAIDESAGESGIALPLWQLQLGFAVFGVAMAGAWFLLQRRLTA